MEKSGEAQIYQKRLMKEIHSACNINTEQKNHFISQINDLTKTSN